MLTYTSADIDKIVAPRKGAWIEIFATAAESSAALRRTPQVVRLKYVQGQECDGYDQVAPPRGT